MEEKTADLLLAHIGLPEPEGEDNADEEGWLDTLPLDEDEGEEEMVVHTTVPVGDMVGETESVRVPMDAVKEGVGEANAEDVEEKEAVNESTPLGLAMEGEVCEDLETLGLSEADILVRGEREEDGDLLTLYDPDGSAVDVGELLTVPDPDLASPVEEGKLVRVGVVEGDFTGERDLAADGDDDAEDVVLPVTLPVAVEDGQTEEEGVVVSVGVEVADGVWDLTALGVTVEDRVRRGVEEAVEEELVLRLTDVVEQYVVELVDDGVLVEFTKLGEAEEVGVQVEEPELVVVREPMREGEDEEVEEALCVTFGDDEEHFVGDSVAVDDLVKLDKEEEVGERVTVKEEQADGVELEELEGEDVTDTVDVVVAEEEMEEEEVDVADAVAVEHGVAERVGVGERQWVALGVRVRTLDGDAVGVGLVDIEIVED